MSLTYGFPYVWRNSPNLEDWRNSRTVPILSALSAQSYSLEPVGFAESTTSLARSLSDVLTSDFAKYNEYLTNGPWFGAAERNTHSGSCVETTGSAYAVNHFILGTTPPATTSIESGTITGQRLVHKRYTASSGGVTITEWPLSVQQDFSYTWNPTLDRYEGSIRTQVWLHSLTFGGGLVQTSYTDTTISGNFPSRTAATPWADDSYYTPVASTVYGNTTALASWLSTHIGTISTHAEGLAAPSGTSHLNTTPSGSSIQVASGSAFNLAPAQGSRLPKITATIAHLRFFFPEAWQSPSDPFDSIEVLYDVFFYPDNGADPTTLTTDATTGRVTLDLIPPDTWTFPDSANPVSGWFIGAWITLPLPDEAGHVRAANIRVLPLT